MILLAADRSLAAKKKRRHGALPCSGSSPKNRVWVFENTPSGRTGSESGSSWENAMGCVQYTYQNASGRREFLQTDPIRFSGGDVNIYRYCGNNSVNFTDPSGKFINILVGAAIGGLVDVGAQLIRNGGDLGDLNYTELGLATAAGALTSGISALATGAGAAVATATESGAAGALTNLAVNTLGGAAVNTGSTAIMNIANGQPVTSNLGSAALSGGLGSAGGSAFESTINPIFQDLAQENAPLLNSLLNSGALQGGALGGPLSGLGPVAGNAFGDLFTAGDGGNLSNEQNLNNLLGALADFFLPPDDSNSCPNQ